METDKTVEEYVKGRPLSKRLHERAKRVFAADGATHSGRVFYPFRPYVIRAKGARKWDVDGNEYLDYVLGHGTLILGHSHPEVVRAVQEQVAKGVHYGENHELEIEWAELIQSMMPSMERIEFFSCGQEANLMAVRLARIYTGRKKILKFEENFHGWADELAVTTLGCVAPEVTIIPGHDLTRLEMELATKEYAVLMLEGGGARMTGQIPWDPEFARAVSGLTREYGTIFVVDEVVTGFRDAAGGWQSIIGVTPDLTTLGKAVGGGLGAGALGGRADVMDILRPKVPPQQWLAHTGTWNANPLTAAAGVAACRLYQDGEVQTRVNALGAYLRKQGNQALKERRINCTLYGRSIVWLYFGSVDYEPSDDTLPPTKDAVKLMSGDAIRRRLCLHLFKRGISTMTARFFVLSTAHTEEDIDHTIKVFIDSMDDMIAEGSLE